uniref:Uncharacterized protein n=1 Tax=Caenorhabditis tropicalis TaxID=1561998 RepID=A0A1I7UF00_9PELO
MKEHPNAGKAMTPSFIESIRFRIEEIDRRNERINRILDQALEAVRLFERFERLMERRHRRIEQIIRETEALDLNTNVQAPTVNNNSDSDKSKENAENQPPAREE